MRHGRNDRPRGNDRGNLHSTDEGTVMAWEDIDPPAKAGRGEYIAIATWKRGGLGVVLSPELTKRLKIAKGSAARLAVNLDGHQLRITLGTGKFRFGQLKGASVVRFGTVKGLFLHKGKHLVDWSEANTGDGLALILDLPEHKPLAADDGMERAPVTPARTVLLNGGEAKPQPHPAPPRQVPASLAPRNAHGQPVSRANDPRYQIPGAR